MAEREPLENLEIKHQNLSYVIEQRRGLAERLMPDNAPPHDDLRGWRGLKVRNRVLASIDRHTSSLEGVTRQIDDYLPQIAKSYQLELIRLERDLRSVELGKRSGLVDVPEEVLISSKLKLQELRDKPLHDPQLARALESTKQPEQPPVPTPPVEEKSKRHQESRQVFEITFDGTPTKVQGKLTMLSLQTLENTSVENKMMMTALANNLYGKGDPESISKARGLMTFSNRRAFPNLNVEAVIEGQRDQATIYLKRLTPIREPSKEEAQLITLILNSEKKTAAIKDKSVTLSNLEFVMLSYVADPVHSAEEITTRVLRRVLQDTGSDNNGVVGITAYHLRQKLGTDVFNKIRKGGIGDTTFIWSIDDRFEVKTIKKLEEPLPSADGQAPDQALDVEKLQSKLNELYQFRTEMEVQVAQGIWPQSDLDELNAQISQKEAQIRLIQPIEPEDIAEESSDVRFIPYEPSPEEIRTEEENKILDSIITYILTNRQIRFEDLQAALGPRIGRVPGGTGIIIYQAKELKDMFQAGLGKFREESVIPNLRSKWNEHDQSLWNKIEEAITKSPGGDVADFAKKVIAQIDRAEREFYRDSPPPENGGAKVQYIRLP